MTTKICKTCKEEKLETDFRPNRSVCKKCINDALVAKRRPSNKLCKGCGVEKDIAEFTPKKQLCKTCLPDPISTGLKRCAACKIVMSVEAFHKQATSLDGVANTCKVCASNSHTRRKHNYDFNSIDLSQTKPCSNCGVTKSYAEFYAKVGSKGGVNSMCKQCCKETIYKYRKLNPVAIKNTRRKHYELYKDTISAYGVAYRIAHQEELNAYGRLYRAIHRDTLLVKDKEKYRSNSARYKNYSVRRRVKLKTLEGSYTSEDIANIWEQQKGLCVYCGADLSSVILHIDHYIPITLGGVNWPHNLQLLCSHCNLTKWAKHPDVYEAQIGFDRTAWEAKFGRCLSTP